MTKNLTLKTALLKFVTFCNLLLITISCAITSDATQLPVIASPSITSHSIDQNFISDEKKSATKKEIEIIKQWKTKSIGEQKFTIETIDENEELIETKGNFRWDLEKNIWHFEYRDKNLIWEISCQKMHKIENNIKKDYPCSGIAMLLKHPINEWNQLLEIKSEIISKEICIVYATYQQKPIIFVYQHTPFLLKEIAFEDTSTNGYLKISFDEN